jgi:hypothetical protein
MPTEPHRLSICLLMAPLPHGREQQDGLRPLRTT